MAQADFRLKVLLPQSPKCCSISGQHHTKLDLKKNFLTKRRTVGVIRNPSCFKKVAENRDIWY